MVPEASRAAIPIYPADASWIAVGFKFPMFHSVMMYCQVDSGMAAKRNSLVFSVAPRAAKKVRRGLVAASSVSNSSAHSQRSFAVRKEANSSAVGSMVLEPGRKQCGGEHVSMTSSPKWPREHFKIRAGTHHHPRDAN